MRADGTSPGPPREKDPAKALARIADIAADVLQPLPREGTLAGQKNVAKKYDVHRTFVSAAVRRAVRENLLSIRIQRLPILKRDAALEEELILRFPRLAVTRVVEEGPAPEAGQDPQQDEYDLHSRVGTAMSSAIAEDNLIHTGAVCLVGSGRAVAHTALALGQRSEPLKSRRVKLLSLSGGYPLMTVCSSRAIGIDADTCTRALAQAFAENVEVHTMTFPIMAPTASAMKLFREMSWIGVANRSGKEGTAAGAGDRAPRRGRAQPAQRSPVRLHGGAPLGRQLGVQEPQVPDRAARDDTGQGLRAGGRHRQPLRGRSRGREVPARARTRPPSPTRSTG